MYLPFFFPTPCSSVIALQLGEGWARRWLIIHRRECGKCVEQDRALDDEPHVVTQRARMDEKTRHLVDHRRMGLRRWSPRSAVPVSRTGAVPTPSFTHWDSNLLLRSDVDNVHGSLQGQVQALNIDCQTRSSFRGDSYPDCDRHS